MRWMEYYRISDLWTKGLHVGFLLATLSVVCLVSCTSFEHLTASGDQFAHAKDCGKCHVDIYREWSQSDHAKAYVNPNFRKATSDYAFESCIGCHAPEPEVTDQTPTARSAGREDGVTCVSCHLKGGKLAGPITPTGVIKPHPIEVDEEFYRGIAVCGRCHEGTLKEWNSVEGYKKACQQCHMQPVMRQVTQATGGMSDIIVAFEKKGMLRRHDFSVSGDYVPGRIINVTAQRNGSLLTVQVANSLPHNLPTGDFGFRVLELQAVAVDKLNHEVVLGKRELAPELSSAVPAGGVLTWDVEIPPDAVGALVRLRRLSYEGADVIVLANVEIPF
jgi:hypothetical protein